MNREYQRLIQRDQHPLTFLYAGVYIARSRGRDLFLTLQRRLST
jgi:hypothetical protein